MLPSFFNYIFAHQRQKVRLRPKLSPKFLSTLGPNPTRKARPDLQLWRAHSIIVQTGSAFGCNLPHHGKDSFAGCVWPWFEWAKRQVVPHHKSEVAGSTNLKIRNRSRSNKKRYGSALDLLENNYTLFLTAKTKSRQKKFSLKIGAFFLPKVRWRPKKKKKSR